MRISIAMSTYNGATYLQAQLDSFLAQTVPPDELVVSDDASTDDTLEILRRFASIAPFPVKILIAKKNQGYVRSFEVALRSSSGDVVFLSDQDDVWFPGKLDAAMSAMVQRGGTHMITVDQIIAGEDGTRSSRTKLSNYRAAKRPDSAFLTGCCSAYSRELVELCLPFPEGITSHDYWLGRTAVSLGVRAIVEEPLQIWRRHGANVSSGFASDSRRPSQLRRVLRSGITSAQTGWRRDIREWQLHRSRLEDRRRSAVAIFGASAVDQAQKQFDDRIAATERRIALMQRSHIARLLPLIKMYANGDYQWFGGQLSAVKDAIRRE